MGVLAGLIAIGFATIFVNGWRKTGLETGGAPIWWNDLRPIHAMLYGVFAYLAYTGQQDIAWKILLVDVGIGFLSFVHHHMLSS